MNTSLLSDLLRHPFKIDSRNGLINVFQEAVIEGKSVYGQVIKTDEKVSSTFNWVMNENYWNSKFEIESFEDFLFFNSEDLNSEYNFPYGYILDLNFPQYFALLTVGDKDVFDHYQKNLLSSYAPILYQNYLNTDQFYSFFGNLLNNPDVENIRVTEYISKQFIENLDSKKTTQTDRQWTDKDVMSVFSEIQEGDEWLSSIKFVIHQNSDIETKIWKNSSFKCLSNFKVWWKDYLQGILDVIEEQKESLKLDSDGKISSVRIVYDDEVFEDTKQNKRFLEKMKSVRDSDLFVYHGNPYIHASMMDHRNGSMFDIWVSDANEIVINPQKDSNIESLDRIIFSIFDEFREGKIEKVQEVN